MGPRVAGATTLTARSAMAPIPNRPATAYCRHGSDKRPGHRGGSRSHLRVDRRWNSSLLGCNRYGQIGDGTGGNGTANNDRLLPTAVTGLTNAVAIAAGGDHTCALIPDGTARCWGEQFRPVRRRHRSAMAPHDNRPLPASVPGLTNAVAIAAGRRSHLRADRRWNRALLGRQP